MSGGSHGIKRITEAVTKSDDGFGNRVTRGTTNKLGLPSFNPFSEERYRFIENGSRVEDPDANSTRFTDRDKDFYIEPDAGDTLEFKSAEAPRYIPGYDSEVTWGFKFDTFLKTADDRLDLFVEGAYELRFFGDGTVTAATIESESDNETRSVTLPDTVQNTDPLRPLLRFNWYNVGRAAWELSYTHTDDDASKQLDELLAVLTDDRDWLSDSPVGKIGFRLDVASSGIQLAAGSMNYVELGAIEPTARPKPTAFSSEELNQIPASGYGVVGAFRIDPNRSQVYTTVTELTISGESALDTELWLKAVPASETDADFDDPDGDGTDEGPAPPRMNSAQNTVLQWTPNVSTFPTRTDPVSNTSVPDGRLVGVATESSSGTGAGVTRQNAPFRRARPVYEDDVVLMIGTTPDQTADTQTVDVYLETEQDW